MKKNIWRFIQLFLVMLTLWQSCRKESPLKYEFFSNIGYKNNKIIFILGKVRKNVEGCNTCKENQNTEAWKALYRVFRHDSDVELIIVGSKEPDDRLLALPADIIKYVDSAAPKNDIFYVYKKGKLIFKHEGKLDMYLIRDIMELMHQ